MMCRACIWFSSLILLLLTVACGEIAYRHMNDPGRDASKETVRQEMEAAGYRLINDFDFLAKQHFQVFAPNTRE